MAANGDIYLDRYAGWYSVRQEAYFDEKETTLGDDGVRREPLGSPVEWNEEESYFFRLSAYQDRLLALYESQSGFRRAGRAPQRGHELRQIRAEGPVDLAHDLQLGRAGARRRQACDVCLGRRADQLHHRAPAIPTPTARNGASGRPTPHHRQGHRPLPRRLLAGLPDVGRHRTAEARVRARLPVQPRREDVEVGRQRRRPVRAWSSTTASTRCAISSCARCRSARTAATATRRSSTAPMPISPTISAIWRSARCR